MQCHCIKSGTDLQSVRILTYAPPRILKDEFKEHQVVHWQHKYPSPASPDTTRARVTNPRYFCTDVQFVVGKNPH